jgi:hypothetical protein
MAKRSVEESSLDSIANAIREKTGSKWALKFPDEMIYTIEQLKKPSTRKSGTVTLDYGPTIFITIPVTDLTKIQTVYLRRVYDPELYINDRIVDTLTMFFNADTATLETATATSYNNYARTSVFYNLNNNSKERLTVYMSESGLGIESSMHFEGYFYGTYYYEVLGV